MCTNKKLSLKSITQTLIPRALTKKSRHDFHPKNIVISTIYLTKLSCHDIKVSSNLELYVQKKDQEISPQVLLESILIQSIFQSLFPHAKFTLNSSKTLVLSVLRSNFFLLLFLKTINFSSNLSTIFLAIIHTELWFLLKKSGST